MISILNYLKTFNLNYFFGTPEATKGLLLWVMLFAFMLILVSFLNSKLINKSKDDKPYGDFAKKIFWSNFYLSLTGFIISLFRYESLPVLAWRFWEYLLAIIIIGLNIYFYFVYKGSLQDEILVFQNKKRKEQWISNKKKHKR